ncbi:MAG: hypothetical protein WCI48_15355 [Bacteroidota bacterium]
MKKINYVIGGGFLKDASYAYYFHELFLEYENKFGDAESIIVSINEDFYPFSTSKRNINFSEDGKLVNITFNANRYQDKKGKFTVKPSPDEVFISLRFVMDTAVSEYSKKFPSCIM